MMYKQKIKQTTKQKLLTTYRQARINAKKTQSDINTQTGIRTKKILFDLNNSSCVHKLSYGFGLDLEGRRKNIFPKN